jgi:hypothetical protein
MSTHLLGRTLAAGALACAALTTAACGDVDLPGYGSGVGDADTASPSPSPSASAGSTMPDGSTDESTGEPSAGALLTVTDVQVSAQDGFDRVELVLDGTGTPGWHVGYVDEALDEGKGDPVEVAGDAILQVHVTGTAMPMDSGVTEYDGAPVAGPDGGAVTEVVYRFVFEGTTTAFVGVDGEPRPFTVTTQTDPTRLVIDVAR